MNWQKIRNWLLIRQGEGALMLHLAIAAMLVGGGLAIGRGSSDALFFKRFGTEYLPHMFFAASFLLMLASVLYARVADRWKPGKVLVAMSAVFAALLGINWLAMQFGSSPYTYVAYFLIYAVASEILLVHFAHYATSFLDVQQGKRLFPMVNAASRVGAIVGGLLLGGLVLIWPATSLALAWIASLLLIVALVLWNARRAAGIQAAARSRQKGGGGLVSAFFFARRSKLLRVTSLGAFLLIILVSLQDYVVATILTRHFVREEDLTAFFGLFFALSNALVLFMQMIVTSRMLQRYGLRAVNMIFPWSTLLSFGLLAWAPNVATATLARFNYMGMLPAFRIPVANLFYKALPDYMQGRARALILGLVLPSGLAVAGLGLMLVPVEMVDSVLPLVGLLLAAAFVAVKFRKNAAYSESLTSLLQQQVFAEKTTLLDEDVRMDRQVAKKIAEGIPAAEDEATAFIMVDMLCELAPQEAGPLLLEVAPQSGVKVKDCILRRLVKLDPEGWQGYAKSLLNHEELRLRSTALEVLAQAGDAAAVETARQWLGSEVLRIRTVALVVLKRAGREDERELAQAALRELLASSLPYETIAAMRALSALGDACVIDALHPLLKSTDARVREIALQTHAGFARSLGRDCAWEVIAALDDTVEEVRVAAVNALPAVHGDTLRLQLLARALTDNAPPVRRAASSQARTLLPDSTESLASAFAEHFHHFDLQALLAGASKRLDQADRTRLLGEVIQRHQQAAMQKRQAAAQIKSAGMSDAVAQVLGLALREEAHRHVCAAVDLLAEVAPSDAMYQAAGALRSLDQRIRAQGLESLQCLGSGDLVRSVVDLVEAGAQPAKVASAGGLAELLATVAHDATPWLKECIESFLGRTQGNEWSERTV